MVSKLPCFQYRLGLNKKVHYISMPCSSFATIAFYLILENLPNLQKIHKWTSDNMLYPRNVCKHLQHFILN